jgi:hypothetical protein
MLDNQTRCLLRGRRLSQACSDLGVGRDENVPFGEKVRTSKGPMSEKEDCRVLERVETAVSPSALASQGPTR